jgi:hypothetical protein
MAANFPEGKMFETTGEYARTTERAVAPRGRAGGAGYPHGQVLVVTHKCASDNQAHPPTMGERRTE